MGSNVSQNQTKIPTKSRRGCTLPFYMDPTEHLSRLAFPNISRIDVVPHPKDWITVLACSNCGYLVIDEYNLCSKEGHLTCRDCWKDYKDLVCQYPVAVSKPSTSNGKCEVEKTAVMPCGSILTDQPHVFIDNLLDNIEFFCPYWREGCKKSIPGKEMRIHYTFKCPFKQYYREPEDEAAASTEEAMPKPKYVKKHRSNKTVRFNTTSFSRWRTSDAE